MKNNRVLRVLLIGAIGGGLGFLDYKTKVKQKELEVLDLVSEVLVANYQRTETLPDTLEDAGYGNMGKSILRYQKISDTEFSLAHNDREFFIDQNQKYHAPNPFIGFKLSIWENYKILFEYYYVFFVVFAGILISSFRTRRLEKKYQE